ncbi:hypothetical protein K4G60_g1650 [Candida parapsilosis]|nr:hypothetical protein K4G60_g1650 [Candida parapsilosis]KAI5908055.1 hypothetical protein K4G61_g1729 [Candida parapsilosis]
MEGCLDIEKFIAWAQSFCRNQEVVSRTAERSVSALEITFDNVNVIPVCVCTANTSFLGDDNNLEDVAAFEAVELWFQENSSYITQDSVTIIVSFVELKEKHQARNILKNKDIPLFIKFVVSDILNTKQIVGLNQNANLGHHILQLVQSSAFQDASDHVSIDDNNLNV